MTEQEKTIWNDVVSQYNFCFRKMQTLQQRLEEKEQKMQGLYSPSFNGFRSSKGRCGKSKEMMIAEKDDLEEEIRSLYEELSLPGKWLEAQISGVKNIKYRLVLRSFYLDREKISSIAEDNGSSVRTVERILKQAVEEMKIDLNTAPVDGSLWR